MQTEQMSQDLVIVRLKLKVETRPENFLLRKNKKQNNQLAIETALILFTLNSKKT